MNEQASAAASTRRHGREPLLAPRSIAAIGASRNPAKPSGCPVAYLKRFGCTGRILPVPPARDEIQGLPSHPSLDAIEIDANPLLLPGAVTSVDALVVLHPARTDGAG
ncbi:CoA-binding protein [Streptomyces mutabilis]|uniref:CoA-binding protein n=1 Tax=Streptomyces mutabilis TaxID=67332 RepID=UPI0033B286B4